MCRTRGGTEEEGCRSSIYIYIDICTGPCVDVFLYTYIYDIYTWIYLSFCVYTYVYIYSHVSDTYSTYLCRYTSIAAVGRVIICMNVSIYIFVLIPAYTCTRLYVHPCLILSLTFFVELLITEAVYI